jgi:hypothetical protein
MWSVDDAVDMMPAVLRMMVDVAFQLVAGVYGNAPPPPDASFPSQRSADPVSAMQVASLLPKVTVPVESMASAATVDVANVDAEDVAR